MVDVDRLNDVILGLENSSHRFSQIGSLVEKIETQMNSAEANAKQLSELSLYLENVRNDVSKTEELLQGSIKNLENYCRESAAQEEKFKGEINTLLLQIKNENHALYRNLETTLISQLDKVKYEVIQEQKNLLNEMEASLVTKLEEHENQEKVRGSKKTIILCVWGFIILSGIVISQII